MVTLSITQMGKGATTTWEVILFVLLGAWAILSFISWRRRK